MSHWMYMCGFGVLVGSPALAGSTLDPGWSEVQLLDHLEGEMVVLEKGMAGDVEARLFPWAGGHRVRLSQSKQGIPLLASTVVVSVDSVGKIGGIQQTLMDLSVAVVEPLVPAAVAKKTARDALSSIGSGELWSPRATLIFDGRSGNPELVWRVDVSHWQPMRTWRVLVDATTGEVLSSRPTSFDATAFVYQSNPVASDLEMVSLRGLTSDKKLSGVFADAWSCDQIDDALNEWNVSCETLSRQASADDLGDFIYSADQGDEFDPFGEVQLYYHADRVARWADRRFNLGWEEPIRVVGNFAMDNAMYGDIDGDGVADLSFGITENGVNLGYDGDVVYHEYGHAMVAEVVDFNWTTADAYGLNYAPGSLNEGFADVISLLRSGDPELGEHAARAFGDEQALRDLEPDRVCPNDLVGEIHEDGQILGSFVWNLMDDEYVGARVAGDLMYGALLLLDADASWEDAGEAIYQTNEEMYAAGLTDYFTRGRIMTHLEESGIATCTRFVDLAESGHTRHLLTNWGLTGQMAAVPLGVQFYIETDENTRRVELNLSNFDGENADLGWVVYVRQGMPVGHGVQSLGETGLSLAYAEDFDWMVEGNDASVQIEVDSQSEVALDPGQTYYFAVAGRNEGGRAAFDIAHASVSVMGVEHSYTRVPYEGQSCASVAGSRAHDKNWVWALAGCLLVLVRRNRQV